MIFERHRLKNGRVYILQSLRKILQCLFKIMLSKTMKLAKRVKLRLHATINRVRFVFWRMSLSKHV